MITQMGFFVGEEYTSCSLYCISYFYSLFILVLGWFAPWVSCAVVQRCAVAWLEWQSAVGAACVSNSERLRLSATFRNFVAIVGWRPFYG